MSRLKIAGLRKEVLSPVKSGILNFDANNFYLPQHVVLFCFLLV